MAAPSVKVGFVLLSPAKAPVPSTRVAVLNMFPYLRAAGFSPEIVFEPARATESPDLRGIDADALLRQGIRVVCFQKVGGAHVEALARALSVRGIKTLFMVCDVVDASMADATDATVVVTDFLKQLYPAPLQRKLSVVHDGIERPAALREEHATQRASITRPLHAVLVTSARLDFLPVLGVPPPWLRITVVGRYDADQRAGGRMREFQWHFRQLPDWKQKAQALGFGLNPRIRCVPWDPEGVYDWLRAADIGIIPIETPPPSPSDTLPPSWKVKSENRLTLKMSMGLPVIATPIPAYESVVRQGVDGFLAQSRADWLKHLEELRDPAHRRQIGHAARASVSARFSMDRQAEKLVLVLRNLLGGFVHSH